MTGVTDKSVFEAIIEEVGRLFLTARDAFGDPRTEPVRVTLSLRSFGWDVPVDAGIPGSVSGFFTALDELSDALDADSPNFIALATSLAALASNAVDLGDDFSSIIPAQVRGEFKDKFPGQFVDHIAVSFLRRHHTRLFEVLQLAGIIATEEKRTVPTGHLPHFETSIRWSAFADLISGPVTHLETEYGWGAASFDHEKILYRLFFLLQHCGVPAERGISDAPAASVFNLPSETLFVPILDRGDVKAGFEVYPLPATAAGNDAGLCVSPYLTGATGFEIDVTDRLHLMLGGDIGWDRAAGVEIRPPANVSFFTVNPGAPDPKTVLGSGEFRAGLRYGGDGKMTLLGSPTGTRFDADGIDIGLSATTKSGAPDYGVFFGIDGASVVLSPGEGDGFLAKLLPVDPARVNFDLEFGFSKREGLSIAGAVGLEYTFQINREFGPFFVNTVELELGVDGNDIDLVTAISGGGAIGPVSFVVQGIGLITTVKLNEPGVLGNADLDIAFKWPDGAGAALELPVVSGGGFLMIDPPDYAGILNLTIQDRIAITAYGIISTRLPDGTKGFSLIVSIMAEFTPIQLGYGFALAGVGGLAGLHRTMVEEALRDTIKNHTMDMILFPQNPIADAVLLIETIKTCFPPREGRHIFGPMIKIIWGGTIELVGFEVGVIIEIGGSGRVAILGQASCQLPDKNAPVLSLNLDVLGFLDIGNGTFALDASIYDSRLLVYELSGDMQMRASWGDRPFFGLSVGGFHPRGRVEHATPRFRDGRPMAVSLGSGNPRVSMTSYYAVTTNTIQFGSHLEVWFKKSGFTIEGGAGFDALIKFSPFSFDVEFRAWVTVSMGSRELLSVDLGAQLTGPNPFKIKGYAKFKILGVGVKVRVKATFGEKVTEIPPVVSPLELLVASLEEERNMRYELPDWASEGLVFTESAEARLDPAGRVVFDGHVPLQFRMQRFGGGVPPSNERTLDFAAKDIPGANHEPYFKKLSPAQYNDWNDSQKLSAPAFDDFITGKYITGLFTTGGPDGEMDFNVETVIRESDQYQGTHAVRGATLTRSAVPDFARRRLDWAAQGPALRNRPLRATKDRSNPNFVTVSDPSYAVTGQSATDGRFDPSTADGQPAVNLNYSRAVSVATGSGDPDASVREMVYVTMS